MKDPLVILGAGLAGLSAAYEARKKRLPHLLFEREARPGGLVRSESLAGFTFDYTGHLLHTKKPETRALVLDELGLKDAFVPVARDSWVFSSGRFTRAPFQANLFGLPPALVRECLEGALQARLGKAPARKSVPGGKQESFESWNLRVFGAGIYRRFMEPYNTKLWGVHPSRMTTEFMGRFVPQPSLREIFSGALSARPANIGYNANFIYPKKGGIEVLARGFARKVAVHTGHEAVALDWRRKEVLFSTGLRQHYSRLVSTLPLPHLVGILKDAPSWVKAAARKLRASSVLNVNFGVAGRDVSSKQWVYVPEGKLPFYRVGFYHNFSRALAPQGGSSVYAEMSYSPERPLDKKKAPARVRDGLISMGLLRKSDKIAATFVADIPDAYVVYDAHRTESVGVIQGFLKEQGIRSTGRWGNWEYAAMEDAIWQGVAAVA